MLVIGQKLIVSFFFFFLQKFVLILDVGTSLITSAICVIAYVATFDTHMW